MPYNPAIHHRRSIRLHGYDYAQAGAYFVTAVAQGRECLFGEVVDDQMILNEMGQVVQAEWERSSDIRREIELDTFVVMPNHVHGIVVITDHNPGEVVGDVGATGRSPLPMDNHTSALIKPGPSKRSLGAFIAGFKSVVTKRINEMRATPGGPVWQRNYYERIIRNENELDRARSYIMNNPQQWALDNENPLKGKQP